MSLLVALVVGVLFGAGAYLMLQPDLFRVVAGMVLISNAALLALMGSRILVGPAPILPLADPRATADPLAQALTLTAIVIGFAVTALLLSLAYRVYSSFETVDLDELSRIEVRKEKELEREELKL